MNGTKNPLQSKTIIGSIITLLAIGLSTFFGYEIGVEDSSQLTEIILSAIGSLGAITAIYGRVKADKKLTLKE